MQWPEGLIFTQKEWELVVIAKACYWDTDMFTIFGFFSVDITAP